MEYQRQFVQSAYTSDEETEASIIRLITHKCGKNTISWLPVQWSFYLSTHVLSRPYVFYRPIKCTWVYQTLSLFLLFFFLNSQFLSVSHLDLISPFLLFYHSRAALACVVYLCLSTFAVGKRWRNNYIPRFLLPGVVSSGSSWENFISR